MNKISIIVITKNEEKNIRESLKSVNWADEIIIVDSESTDKTISIAREFTDKIFIEKWRGFAEQKSYALSLAKNNWVLSIDADERITEKLKKEIIALGENNFDGYYIKRKNHFLGKEIKTCGWADDKQLRLFKKNKTKLTNRLVHEGFTVEGNVSILSEAMIHLTYNSIKEAIEKINNYSSLQALEQYKNKKTSGFAVLGHSLSAFLRFFISKKGYKEGMHGFVISMFNSITSILTYMKIWELRRKEKLN